MKNLLLVACLLTISFAIDPAKVKKFYDVIDTCVQELNKPGLKSPLKIEEYTPDIILCSLKKHELLDGQGLILKEKVLDYCDYLISDETKISQAKDIETKCFEQANQNPGSNDEKTMTFIKCATQVIDLFDKP